MAKPVTKPIAQLIMAVYFAPLLVLFVFENSASKDKLSFALSVSAVSLSALVLYLTFKKWETDFRMLLSMRKKEEEPKGDLKTITAPEMIAAPYIAEIEAKEKLLQERDEAVLCLREEKELIVQEKQSALGERDQMNRQLKLELDEKEALFQKMQAELLEKQLQAKIQEEVIGKLHEDISNLNFELRTILKVTTSSRSS